MPKSAPVEGDIGAAMIERDLERAVQDFPLIRTKLYRPALTADHVSRARLLELMRQSLNVPLTLVTAPAGYGKSTLISEWLRQYEGPYAWLSLDVTESQLAPFVHHLVAAVRMVFADACEATHELLQAHELPSAATFAAYLINDLDRLGRPFVIVLDDYHALRRSSPVHMLLEGVVVNSPPSLHLVLATRSDPPWQLTNLRARGRVSEPMSRQLAFTEDEAAEFFTAAGCPVEERLIRELHARVEGWPVGWRLLLQALRRGTDADSVIAALNGDIPNVRTFLLSEVLERLDPQTRQFLLRTSILERFCAELVDAVCRPDDEPPSGLDGHTFIGLLRQEGLFAIELDPRHAWVRYHHVFQESLRAELRECWPAADIDVLHVRASEWLERHGHIESAIRHALAASNAEAGAGIVERNFRQEFETDRWRVVEAWLDLIPATVKKQRLESMLAIAWVACFTARFDVLRLLVPALDRLIENGTPDRKLSAEAQLFKGVSAYWAGAGTESQRCLEQSLALSPPGEQLSAASARLFLALAEHRNGEGERARASLRAEVLASAVDEHYSSRLLAAKAMTDLLSADARPAGTTGRQLEQVGTQGKQHYARYWGIYLHAASAFQSHRLADAKDAFTRLMDGRHLLERRAAADAMAGLALTCQLLGEPSRAISAATDLLAFAGDSDDPQSAGVAEACRARLALLQGDLETAVRWERQFEAEADYPSFVFWIEIPEITRVRVQIAEATERSLRAAVTVLREMRPKVDAAHFDCHTIELNVLQAVADEELGQLAEALTVLDEALALAAPGEWVRPFIEAPVGGLLSALRRGSSHAEFVERVLAIRDSIGADSRAAAHRARPLPLAGLGRHNLTNRELDILELAAQRLRSKEIAARLHISNHTVKDHLKHIYQKLGVSRRGDAVAAAIAARIIE
jgi:LuxR family maltose regulon positive regulatory protein